MTRNQPVKPIFVGGSGRSGTTITGRLLGSHSRIWLSKPREVSFITDQGGLLDLVLGLRSRGFKRLCSSTDVNQFVRDMRGRWWLRTGPTGSPRGLYKGFDRAQFLQYLDNFATAYPRGAREASVQLVDDLLGGKATAEGAVAFVDTTPPNAENAHRIIELFPDAKVLHLVRDGRDVAASVIQKEWGPNHPLQALSWWYEQTLAAHRSLATCPAQNVLEVNLEALVLYDRDKQLNQIFSFLGYDPSDAKTFFDREVSIDKLHKGSWRQHVSPNILGQFEERYGQLHSTLINEGVILAPL